MVNDPLKAINELSEVGLKDPVLIAAFRGWNDAGDAATFAAMHLCRVWSGKKFASIDPEEFYDFQTVRPHVQLEDGVRRKIIWPANEFWAAHLEGVDQDVIVLIGTEPSLRWRTFSSIVVEVARRHNVTLALTFGALLADVPHSRPVDITGTAADPGLAERLQLQRSNYEGPTGIVGVLHHAFGSTGVDSASLWAAVPHYLAVSPNPKAALALTRKAVKLLGVTVETQELERATLAYEERVAKIVSTDEDVQAYVRLLEARADERAREEIDPATLPSADALAAELESFLRNRSENPEG